MHLALSAIKLGEIKQALIIGMCAQHLFFINVLYRFFPHIGGNIIVYPEHMVFFSKLGVLSPTGSSKSFDASADGYARYDNIIPRFIC